MENNAFRFRPMLEARNCGDKSACIVAFYFRKKISNDPPPSDILFDIIYSDIPFGIPNLI